VLVSAGTSPYGTTTPHRASRTMFAIALSSLTMIGFPHIIASNSLTGLAYFVLGTLGSSNRNKRSAFSVSLMTSSYEGKNPRYCALLPTRFSSSRTRSLS